MLSCTVKSIEDHGYILETGLPLKAFLTEKNSRQFARLLKTLKLSLGQYILCSVNTSINNYDSHNYPKYLPVGIYNGITDLSVKAINKICQIKCPDVTSKYNKYMKKILNMQMPPSLDSLLPGSIISVSVIQHLPSGHEVSCKLSNHGFLPALLPWVSYLHSTELTTLLPKLPTLSEFKNVSGDDFKNKQSSSHQIHTILSNNVLRPIMEILKPSNFSSILSDTDRGNYGEYTGKLYKFPVNSTICPAIVTYVNHFTKSFMVSVAPQLISNILYPVKYGLRNCNIDYSTLLTHPSSPSPYKICPKVQNLPVASLIFRTLLGKVITASVVNYHQKARTNAKGKRLPRGIYSTFTISNLSPSNTKDTTGHENGARDDTTRLQLLLGFGLTHRQIPATRSMQARILDFDLLLGIVILDYDYSSKPDWPQTCGVGGANKILKNLPPKNGASLKHSSNSSSLTLKEEIALNERTSQKQLIRADSEDLIAPSSQSPEFTLAHAKTLQKWVVPRNEWTNYYAVKLGSIVHGCEVLNYSQNEGVAVKINNKIRGFIPIIHLSDIPAPVDDDESQQTSHALIEKYRREFYVPGKLLTLRVTGVLPERTRLILTHKKSLIDTSIEPFTSLQQNPEPEIVQGWIVQIRKGLLVAFYGFVKGWLRFNSPGVLPETVLKNQLSVQPDKYYEQELKKIYGIGQVLTCRIKCIRHDKEEIDLELYADFASYETTRHLNLSLKSYGVITQPKNHLNSRHHLEVGECYKDCLVVGKTRFGFTIRVSLVDKKFPQDLDYPKHDVEKENSFSDSEVDYAVEAFLPFSELSDFPGNGILMERYLPLGYVFKNLLCIANQSRTQLLTNRLMYRRILGKYDQGPEELSQVVTDGVQLIALPLPKSKYSNTDDCRSDLLPDIYCAGKLKCILRNVGLILDFPDGSHALIHKSQLPLLVKQIIDGNDQIVASTTDSSSTSNRPRDIESGHLLFTSSLDDFMKHTVNLAIGRTIVAKVVEIKENLDSDDNELPQSKSSKKISLTLNPLQTSDRGKVSFQDDGATLLSDYLRERFDIFRSIFMTRKLPDIIRPGTRVRASLHDNDGTHQHHNFRYFKIVENKTDNYLILARVYKSNWSSTIQSENCDGEIDLIVNLPEELLYSDQHDAAIPSSPEQTTLVYSAFPIPGDISLPLLPPPIFPNTQQNNSVNKSDVVVNSNGLAKGTYPAILLGLQPTIHCSDNLDDESTKADPCPFNTNNNYQETNSTSRTLDRRIESLPLDQPFYAVVLCEIPVNSSKAKRKDSSGGTINATHDGKDFVVAYLPLYRDHCELLPDPKIVRDLFRATTTLKIFGVKPILDMKEALGFPLHVVQFSQKNLRNNFSSKSQLLHTLNLPSSATQKTLIYNASRTNDESSPSKCQSSSFPNTEFYTVAKKSATFLTLEPGGVRLYVDEIYKRFYSTFKSYQTDQHPKILSQFCKGFKFSGEELYTISVERLRIRKKLIFSNFGYISQIPILAFKNEGFDGHVVAKSPVSYNLDDMIGPCFVESVQEEKRRVIFHVSVGVKAVCKDVDLSIHKKVLLKPRLVYKPGHVFKYARVIGKYSNDGGAHSEESNRRTPRISSRSSHLNQKSIVDKSEDIITNNDFASDKIIYKISFFHPNSLENSAFGDPTRQSSSSTNLCVAATFLKKLPYNLGYLFKLPRNHFAIATVFDLPCNNLESALTYKLPERQSNQSLSSIHKCRILTKFLPFLQSSSAYPTNIKQAAQKYLAKTVRNYVEKTREALASSDVQTNDNDDLYYLNKIQLVTLKHQPNHFLETWKIPVLGEESIENFYKIGDEVKGIVVNLPGSEFKSATTIVMISLYPTVLCLIEKEDASSKDCKEDYTDSLVQQQDPHLSVDRFKHGRKHIVRDRFSFDLFCNGGIYNVVICKITSYCEPKIRDVKKNTTFYLRGSLIRKVAMPVTDKTTPIETLESRQSTSDKISHIKQFNITGTDEKILTNPTNDDTKLKTNNKRFKSDLDAIKLKNEIKYDWWATDLHQSPSSEKATESSLQFSFNKDHLSTSFPDITNGPVSLTQPKQDDVNIPQHVSRRAQKRELERLETEAFVQQIKVSNLPLSLPTSLETLEKDVIANPNDSYFWSQYIAYYVSSNQISKAREMVKRALQTISFREESERLNVWTTSLNLELMLSPILSSKIKDLALKNSEISADFEKVLHEALQYNDPKKIYTRLLKIYVSNELYSRADETFKDILSLIPGQPKPSAQGSVKAKLVKDAELWCAYFEFLMKNYKKPSVARQMLTKALIHLDKSQHVDAIIKFALLEFEYGHVERGKTMFQKVLKSYPKRTDIWFRYLDALIKRSFINDAKIVLQELIGMKFDKKSRKAIYKRILDFEVKYGNFGNLEKLKETFADVVDDSH